MNASMSNEKDEKTLKNLQIYPPTAPLDGIILHLHDLIRDAMDDICSILNKHSKSVLYFGVKPNGDVC